MPLFTIEEMVLVGKHRNTTENNSVETFVLGTLHGEQT